MNQSRREIADAIFGRDQTREEKSNDAFAQESARRGAAIKNMYRLRSLRLARDEKLSNAQ